MNERKRLKLTMNSGVIIAFGLLVLVNVFSAAYSIWAMGQLKQHNAQLRAGLDSVIMSLGDMARENGGLAEQYRLLAAQLEAMQVEEIDMGEVALGALPEEVPEPVTTTVPPRMAETTTAAELSPETEPADPTTQPPEPTEPVTEPATQPTEPDADALMAGDEVVVSVYAASVSDLYGYQFSLYFDEDVLAFAAGLKSHVSGIDMIFSKPFEGYRLVGATMVGSGAGCSGDDFLVCEMKLSVVAACQMSQLALSLEDLRLVNSAGSFMQTGSDWRLEVAKAP